MNTESINLTENPLDFVEPYFTKKTWTFNNRAVLREFCKKTLDFVKMILKSINFMKIPLNFSVIDRYSVDAKFTKQPPQSTNFTKIPRTFCCSIF